MKKESLKATLVIVGAVLFNIIFWNEKLGINGALFSVFIVGCIFYLYPWSLKNKVCRLLFTAHVLTMSMVIFHNTPLSKMAFSATMLLFVSFSQYLHRSVWYAGGSVVLNYVFAIPSFFSHIKNFTRKGIKFSGFTKPVRMLLLPLIIVTVFIIIYASANTVFSNIASNIANAVENWFAHFFDWFSFERFVFFLAGIFVTGGLIFAVRNNRLSVSDMQKADHLSRRRRDLKKWKESSFSDLISVITGRSSSGILALKNEFIIGLISLALLNILLLFINLLDVKYVWLGFKYNSDVNMVSYVHEGAGLLILSIVLAMLLLLFFFRANLNFYKKSKWLKYGAYLWILQNLFLVISVSIRDYYYISNFGLAYKRIGLLFFLAMVAAGLFTVFLKIYTTKTTYYLLRINAWAGIFLLVFASTINWDVTIADYNLARKNSIPLDISFLLSLSDKTLPLIEKNKEILQNKSEGRTTALEFFEYRKQAFQQEQKNYSWLSWNVADASVMKELKTSSHISLK